MLTPTTRIAICLLAASLLPLTGCTTTAERLEEQRQTVAWVKEAIARFNDAAAVNYTDPWAMQKAYAREDLSRLRYHAHAVEPIIRRELSLGNCGAAWFSGYLKIRAHLPLLEHNLLNERHRYGWQGPGAHAALAYLEDRQYPQHWPYIHAIERINNKPLGEAITLSDRDLARLNSDASRAVPSLRNNQPDDGAFAAWWLLIQLGRAAPVN